MQKKNHTKNSSFGGWLVEMCDGRDLSVLCYNHKLYTESIQTSSPVISFRRELVSVSIHILYITKKRCPFNCQGRIFIILYIYIIFFTKSMIMYLPVLFKFLIFMKFWCRQCSSEAIGFFFSGVQSFTPTNIYLNVRRGKKCPHRYIRYVLLCEGCSTMSGLTV